MKKCSLILAILVLTALYAAVSLAAEETEAKELGFWVETQVSSAKLPAKAIVWFERDVTEKFGFFAFLWKESDGYNEYIAGPYLKPVEDVQLGVGIGRETVREEGQGTRRMFFLDATRNNFNFYFAAEGGKISGPWKKATLTYAVNERFEVGVIHETGFDNGLLLKWNARKNLQFWTAIQRGNVPGTDDILEKKSILRIAINFSF